MCVCVCVCVCVCSFHYFVRSILDVCFVSVVFCSLKKVLAFLAPVSGKKCMIFILFLIPYFLCHLKKQYFQTTLFLEHLSVSSKIQCTEMNMTEEEKVTKMEIIYIYIYFFCDLYAELRASGGMISKTFSNIKLNWGKAQNGRKSITCL